MHRRTDPAVDTAASPEVAAFIARWAASSGAERANKDSFLVELCDVLEVPRPDPVTGDFEADRYVFEQDALLAHEGGRVSTGKVIQGQGWVFRGSCVWTRMSSSTRC